MQKLYSTKSVGNLIERYIAKGGNIATITEGTLGYGFTILYGNKHLRTFIIKEVALNEWNSTHTIRGYARCPKKYVAMIEEYENRTEEE